MTKKRVAAAILWTYTGWTADAMTQVFIGTPALLGLAVGVVAAVFFGLDPLHVGCPKAEEKPDRVDGSASVGTAPAIGRAAAR